MGGQRISHFNIFTIGRATGTAAAAKKSFVKMDKRFVVACLDINNFVLVPHNENYYEKEKEQYDGYGDCPFTAGVV